MALSRDEIYEKVKNVLVDALGVDDDEVTPEATLRGDLGAESIDFLDIVFRLEKEFSKDKPGFKIPRGELFPENLLSDPTLVENGKVTTKGIALLKERMPHSDFSKFEADPTLTNMEKLFTVDTIVNYLHDKLK